MQKQTQLVEQNQGFSYQRRPATDAAAASAADLAAVLGDPTEHLTEADSGYCESAKTNPLGAPSHSSVAEVKTQKQTQLVEQNQGFSYQRRPATDATAASAADLAAMIGDAGYHLIEADSAYSKKCKNKPNAIRPP